MKLARSRNALLLVFVLALGLTGCHKKAVVKDPPAAGHACSKADIKLAINPNNHKFPHQMDACASETWGDAKKTAKCIKKSYPTLSDSCATCFGEVADCSASNCKWKCLSDHFSDGCLECVNSHCKVVDKKNDFSLITCTGLSPKQLPPNK